MPSASSPCDPLPQYHTYHDIQAEDLEASVGPFLLSSDFAQGDDEVTALCGKLAAALAGAFGGGGT